MTSRELEKLKALIWMEFGPLGAAKSIFPVEVHQEREMPGLAGGGGGIRTHETLLGPNGFQDRRFQPLTHPSEIKLFDHCNLHVDLVTVLP